MESCRMSFAMRRRSTACQLPERHCEPRIYIERMATMSNGESNSRRAFLKQVTGASSAVGIGSAIAFLPVGVTLTANPTAASAQAATPAVAPVTPAGYTSFSADEAVFVEAMVDVMCPAD